MSVINKIDYLLGDEYLKEATEFQKFFKKMLKKWGVDSPDDLPEAKRRKFFLEIDKKWKAKNESLSEAKAESIMMKYGPYAKAKKMGLLGYKKSGPAGEVKSYPGTGMEHYHPEKRDEKIPTKDKGTVKSYPGTGKEHYDPNKQDVKVPGHKTDVKGYPGDRHVHYDPNKQDVKISGNKGDVKSYPGTGKEHYDPNKMDQKMAMKDKGAVKSYPGTGKEHYDPNKQDEKISGNPGDMKQYPGDKMARQDASIMGYTRQPMMEQATQDVEKIQKKFGPKKKADELEKEKKEKDKDKKKKKKEETIEEIMKNENANLYEAYEKAIERDWANKMVKDILETEELNEKWKKKVKIEKTGEHAGKSIDQLKKQICEMKGSENFDREKFSELLFALRSKQGWEKGEGATKLPC